MKKGIVLLFLIVLAIVPAAVASAQDPPFHDHFVLEGGDMFYCDDGGGYTIDDSINPPIVYGAEAQIEGRYTAKIDFLLFLDKDGIPVKTITNGTFHGTLTNVATGQFIRDREAWSDKEDLLDGTYKSSYTWNLVVPGEGSQYHAVGQVIFDPSTGETTLVAGQHPWIGPDGIYPDYCQIIADGYLVFSHPLP